MRQGSRTQRFGASASIVAMAGVLSLNLAAGAAAQAPPASPLVMPAMYQERVPDHARQVTRSRQGNEAQLRLF